jgi:hypothetical protein
VTGAGSSQAVPGGQDSNPDAARLSLTLLPGAYTVMVHDQSSGAGPYEIYYLRLRPADIDPVPVGSQGLDLGDGTFVEAAATILATGHSAREIWHALEAAHRVFRCQCLLLLADHRRQVHLDPAQRWRQRHAIRARIEPGSQIDDGIGAGDRKSVV